jgi:ribosome maturation factor RimP
MAGRTSKPAKQSSVGRTEHPVEKNRRTAALLQPSVREVVEAAGYDLEDLTVSRAGRRDVLRIVVDRDGGVDLDAVAEVSREISKELDRHDGEFDSPPYTLEVTSPGVDRPLTQPRHWRRNVGRLVAVTAGGTGLTARIAAADESGVRLKTDDGARDWQYAQLGPGRVKVEFGKQREEQESP